MRRRCAQIVLVLQPVRRAHHSALTEAHLLVFEPGCKERHHCSSQGTVKLDGAVERHDSARLEAAASGPSGYYTLSLRAAAAEDST